MKKMFASIFLSIMLIISSILPVGLLEMRNLFHCKKQ